MSHTFETKGVIFIFNSDFSGDVLIVSHELRLSVPAEAILEFVAEKYIKRELLGQIEDAEWEEILRQKAITSEY